MDDPIADMQAARDRAIATEAGGGLTRPPESNPPGTESKFTEARRKAILGALQANHFMPTAAALAGVGTKTVYEWIRRGVDDRDNGLVTDFSEFADKVEQSTAMGEHKALSTVQNAADKGDVKAAEWILERRHGDRWARKDKLEVHGDPSQPIVVQLTWPGGGVVDAESDLALPAPQPVDNGGDNDVVDAEVIEPDAAAG